MRNIVYLIPLLCLFSCSSKDETDVPTTLVKEGTFVIDLVEEGEIKTSNSTTISAPNISYRYGELKISNIVDDGLAVNKGDTVLSFDKSEVIKAIELAESTLEINQAELEKMQAEHDLQIEELEADLKISKIDHEISKIKFETSDYESEIRKKEIGLNLKQAEIALVKAEEQIKNRKKIQYEEIQQKALEIKQSKSIVEEGKITTEIMDVTSPSNGLVIIKKNWSSDEKFQSGDQVWNGTPLITLPDLSEIVAEIRVNEVDVSKVQLGSKVEIMLDAFSTVKYSGEVTSIANLAVQKERNSAIKVFPIDITIDGTDEKLMPGLTASCKIFIKEIDNVRYIPLEALFSENDVVYVYVKQKGEFVKRLVKSGETNSDYVIITDGLKVGDEIALANPFAEENSNQ